MNVCVTVTEFALFHIPSAAPYDLGRRASNLGEDAVWSQSSSSLSFLLSPSSRSPRSRAGLV